MPHIGLNLVGSVVDMLLAGLGLNIQQNQMNVRWMSSRSFDSGPSMVNIHWDYVMNNVLKDPDAHRGSLMPYPLILLDETSQRMIRHAHH